MGYTHRSVADPLTDIPNRAAFKASEVCEIAQIPPYVLRSWEKEFPGLGVASKPGGPRVYRRSDIEHVLRIKQLLFTEGLTLAGVRRKLEGDVPPASEPEPALPVPDAVREKVSSVKRELRSLLDLLSVGAPAATAKPRRTEEAAAADEARPLDPPTAAAPSPADQEPAPPGAAPPAATGKGPVSGSTWPPAPPAGTPETGLPLLNGVPDSPSPPARPRRPRRAAKG